MAENNNTKLLVVVGVLVALVGYAVYTVLGKKPNPNPNPAPNPSASSNDATKDNYPYSIDPKKVSGNTYIDSKGVKYIVYKNGAFYELSKNGNGYLYKYNISDGSFVEKIGFSPTSSGSFGLKGFLFMGIS